jgi:hypothetical protein
MIAMRELLVRPAKEAGMKVPTDLHHFDPNEYPHWYVFCQMQIGRRIPTMSEHWNNAKIIAGIPDNKIEAVTCEGLMALGFQ